MIYTESNKIKFVMKLTRKAVSCEMVWWIDIGGGNASHALFLSRVGGDGRSGSVLEWVAANP